MHAHILDTQVRWREKEMLFEENHIWIEKQQPKK